MCLVVVIFVLAALFGAYFLFALVGTVFAFIPWIIVGLLAGAIASRVTESRHGCLGDILIGLAGSVIGGVLYVALTHQPEVGGPFNLERIVMATLGAIVLLLVVKAVQRTA